MRLLSQNWNDVRDRYLSISEREPWASAMLALVEHVEASPLCNGLFPWTSMFDLIISQTPGAPEDGGYPFPHLRITPRNGKTFEFRYVDTFDKSRQWAREVESESLTRQFDKFVSQLGWLAAG